MGPTCMTCSITYALSLQKLVWHSHSSLFCFLSLLLLHFFFLLPRSLFSLNLSLLLHKPSPPDQSSPLLATTTSHREISSSSAQIEPLFSLSLSLSLSSLYQISFSLSRFFSLSSFLLDQFISASNFVIWFSNLRILSLGLLYMFVVWVSLCICVLVGLDFWLWLLRLGLWWRLLHSFGFFVGSCGCS